MTKALAAAIRVSVIAPTAAATTALTANLDTSGAHFASVVVAVGAKANTNGANPTVTITERDNTNDATTAISDDYNGVAIVNTAAAVKAVNVPLQGRKRYLHVAVTPGTTATTDAVTIACVGELDPEIRTT